MKNKNIAIIFDDLTEFFVMRDAIDDMYKEKIPVDIIVPYDSGYNGLAEYTYNKIKESGYSPLKDAPKNKTYKILLTPYPGLNIVQRMKYIYHIRYPYGAATTKPNPVFLPEWKIDYDAIFSFNTDETTFLNAYGASCYTLPNWNFYKFKKTTSNLSKPRLLVLPTFGLSSGCLDGFTNATIKEIKKHFYIIAKSHHATHFKKDEKNAYNKLKKLADEFHDSDIPVIELLKNAEVVLSDNSGAIFEAVCAEIPVALFSKDLNIGHLESIDTLQYSLTQEGLFPYTNKPNELLSILLSTKKYYKKQLSLKNRLFLPINQQSIKVHTSIIKEYIEKNSEQDYRKVLHDLALKERTARIQQIQNLENKQADLLNQITLLQKSVSELNQAIQNIYSSTSWKITKPLRKIKEPKRKE